MWRSELRKELVELKKDIGNWLVLVKSDIERTPNPETPKSNSHLQEDSNLVEKIIRKIL